MTIDQMSEIAEWLSPLDDYGFGYDLQEDGAGKVGATIVSPNGTVCDLFFTSKGEEYAIEVGGPDESEAYTHKTSVWKQICLRVL